MPKGKGQSAEPGQGGKEILRWTEDMDQILLNALSEEAVKGNRHDGAWTTEAYSNVVDALRSTIPFMTKQHIKNRMKTLKDNFAEAYDLFNSLSGFAWNPMTRRFEAEEEVWEDLIREKPHAIKWKTMQIRHYDIMKELFATDRATGKRSFTSKMRLHQYQKDNIDLNDSADDTNMRDPNVGMFDERQFSPLNIDSFSPAYGQSHQSTGTSGSRGTKRKAPMVDLVEAQLERMSGGIGLVADALNKGNSISDDLREVARQQITIAEQQMTIAERQVAAIERRNEIMQQSRPRVYTEADIWDMLSELNLMEHHRLQCYQFLCNDDRKKRQVFGVPAHMRLQVLFQMMSDSGHH